MAIRWLIACLLFALLVSPMLPLIYQSFIDRPSMTRARSLPWPTSRILYTDPQFHAVLWNTFWFALIGTLISTTIGFLAALVLERLELPFRRTLKILFLSPIFLSALILAFAWSMLYGPSGYAALFLKAKLGVTLPNINSWGGMSLLAGVAAAPVSYLFFAAAMGNISSTLEDAARAAGASAMRTTRTIILPLLLPSLLYCLLLNFVLKMDQLAVPLLFGEPARIEVLATYPTSTASRPRPTMAS